jgi:hypothetical protein
MTTPIEVVTKEWPYSVSENGCSIISAPAEISTVASVSIGPRRSAFGQRDAATVRGLHGRATDNGRGR